MPYDINSDRHGSSQSSRESAAVEAIVLVTSMISDTVDLPIYAKALRIWNGSTGNITLLVTTTRSGDDSAAGAVPITVPPGVISYDPISVRRIWSTGSTGLLAALAAGTAEVILLRA